MATNWYYLDFASGTAICFNLTIILAMGQPSSGRKTSIIDKKRNIKEPSHKWTYQTLGNELMVEHTKAD